MAQFTGRSSTWTIDVSGMEEVIKAVATYGVAVEDELNKSIHGIISEELKIEIKNNMPKSDRQKTHAKTQKSLTKEEFNLGVKVKPYPKYRYLVFPELAIGTSKKKEPQLFFANSLDKRTDFIYEEMNRAIQRGIDKVEEK